MGLKGWARRSTPSGGLMSSPTFAQPHRRYSSRAGASFDAASTANGSVRSAISTSSNSRPCPRPRNGQASGLKLFRTNTTNAFVESLKAGLRRRQARSSTRITDVENSMILEAVSVTLPEPHRAGRSLRTGHQATTPGPWLRSGCRKGTVDQSGASQMDPSLKATGRVEFIHDFRDMAAAGAD